MDTSVILAAVLTVARAPAVDPDVERPRLEALSEDIGGAVDAGPEVPFRGVGAELASALALVAIAQHESEFMADVQDCRRRGDGGASVSLWQVHEGRNWAGHERAEICADPELAARLALAVLVRAAGEVRTPGGLFGAYAGRTGDASRATCAIWEGLARDAGLAASCSGSLVVGWRNEK